MLDLDHADRQAGAFMIEDPKRPRVLAVDDNHGNLVALEAVLGEDNELVLTRSGEEAISTLEKDPTFDVILMDIQMPGMDGYEAARRIKKMPSCADIPLIFITAIHRQDPDIMRGYDLGAVDYFMKPFDPGLLKLKVEMYTAFSLRSRILKVRERQLRESEEVMRAGREYASTLAHLPVGVLIADAQGRICQATDEALGILKSVCAIETGAFAEVLIWWERHEDSFKSGHSPLNRVLATGIAWEVTRTEGSDGTQKSLLESTSPLRGPDGTVAGAVIVLRDVTEHKKSEVALEARIARLASLGTELERRG